IGADLVVSGDLLRLGGALRLDLRLHETQGGQLLAGAVASGRTVEELESNMSAAVGELLAPVRFQVRVAPEVRRTPAPVAALRTDETKSPLLRKAAFGLIGGSVVLGAGGAVAASRSEGAAWPLGIAAAVALVAGVV